MSDQAVAVEVIHRNGQRDLIVSQEGIYTGAKDASVVHLPRWGLKTDAAFCMVRTDPEGTPIHLAGLQGTAISLSGTRLRLPRGQAYWELSPSP